MNGVSTATLLTYHNRTDPLKKGERKLNRVLFHHRQVFSGVCVDSQYLLLLQLIIDLDLTQLKAHRFSRAPGPGQSRLTANRINIFCGPKSLQKDNKN